MLQVGAANRNSLGHLRCPRSNTDSRNAPPRRTTVRDAAPREARDKRWPGRLIEWSSTISRALSPFSRGRRIPAFAGTGRKRGWNRPLHPAPAPLHPSPRDDLPLVGPFSPLSRGETWGQAPCFVNERGAHPAAAAGKTTPVVPTRSEGAGGVGGDDSPTGCAAHDSRPHDPRFTIHDPRSTTPNSPRRRRCIASPDALIDRIGGFVE
jgi:hypothetical protein